MAKNRPPTYRVRGDKQGGVNAERVAGAPIGQFSIPHGVPQSKEDGKIDSSWLPASVGGGVEVKEAGATVTAAASSLDFTNANDFVLTDASPETDIAINRNAANGIAGLDAGALLPLAQLPGHASTHKNGGTDEVATAAPAANGIPKAGAGSLLDTAWLPAATTLVKGTVELATSGENAANVVVQGNDARLSDSRTPTAHATSHQDTGSDEINVNALSGELADKQKVAVMEEGAVVGTRNTINFIGAGVTAVDNAGSTRVDVTIPGGSGNTAYAPGSFTVTDGHFQFHAKQLILTGAERATLQGDSRLVIF